MLVPWFQLSEHNDSLHNAGVDAWILWANIERCIYNSSKNSHVKGVWNAISIIKWICSTYCSLISVVKFEAMMAIDDSWQLPRDNVASWTPLYKVITTSLIALCDLGSSMANSKLLSEQSETYFSFVPFETHRCFSHPKRDRPQRSAVDFPVPGAPKMYGTGQYQNFFRMVV